MKKRLKYTLYLLLIGIASGMMLVSCNTAEKEWSADGEQSSQELSGDRQLVHHEVSVSLDGAVTRVGYRPSGDGLQLSWEANETLGVYIKNGSSYTYAGTVTSRVTSGDGGSRVFSGDVRAKTDGEKYVYVHPALTGETQGSAAAGTIDFTTQSASLGSTEHLKNYIPLVWEEGQIYAANHGYVIHLSLSFAEDPGTITSVALQTMDGVGTTKIFPKLFSASTMAVSAADENMTDAVTLMINGSATQNGNEWTADAYLASSHVDANVFRTKYIVKVVGSNGTFYNEYRSFPGQESADASTGLQMLANGKCYNLITPVSKGVATTVINSQYKVNSLLGMWNEFGKVTDPFGLTVSNSNAPYQLKENILDRQIAFTNRTKLNVSSQGSPTFTWDMLTKQCNGQYKQNNVTYNNIEIVNAPTEVYVTFISEYAWSQNLLGYYHYPTSSVPGSSSEVLKTIIFPNVSKSGHVPFNLNGSENITNVNPNTSSANVGNPSDAPLSEYTTVQLLYNYPDGTVSTLFPVGTTIGFFMMRDPKASSSGHDEGSMGDTNADTHSGYQPRTDNTLLDWTSWRLFTNTAWNGVSGNNGWWDSNCWNFFCSADVGNSDSGGVIPGLALYGAKDDASHNYNYSFSAMLYMVSTGDPQSLQTQNKCYFNIGTGAQIIDK